MYLYKCSVKASLAENRTIARTILNKVHLYCVLFINLNKKKKLKKNFSVLKSYINYKLYYFAIKCNFVVLRLNLIILFFTLHITFFYEIRFFTKLRVAFCFIVCH